MIILINEGNIFEGTIEQFKDNFFDNATVATIGIWCNQNGYTFSIKIKIV